MHSKWLRFVFITAIRIAELDKKIDANGNATDAITAPQGSILKLRVMGVQTPLQSGKLFYSVADNRDEHFFSSKSMPMSK